LLIPTLHQCDELKKQTTSPDAARVFPHCDQKTNNQARRGDVHQWLGPANVQKAWGPRFLLLSKLHAKEDHKVSVVPGNVLFDANGNTEGDGLGESVFPS
jgi:hypothetical protein